MPELSPVLQAFFAGQQHQTSLISQARELQAAAEGRKEKELERQQRQQEIDNLMSRFDASHKLEQKRVELEQNRTQTEHDMHLFNARQAFQQGLHNETIPLQKSFIPQDLAVPGIPAAPESGIPGLPGVNIPGGGLPQEQVNPIQTQDTPLGQISVPAPQLKSTLDKAAEQARSDIALNQARSLYSTTTGPDKQAALDLREKALEQRGKDLQDTLNNKILMIGMGFGNKMELEAVKRQFEEAKGVNFRTPEEFQQDIKNSANQIATGRLKLNDIHNPREQVGVREYLDSKKLQAVDPKKAESIMSHATDAAQAVSILAQMKELLPTDKAGQISNVIRNLVPFGLNANASKFSGLQNDLIAPLERARGLSLARAGASPGIQKLQKLTAPSFTDAPEAVDTKLPETVDIHLTAAQNDLANFTPEHRKEFYKRFVEEYPSLLNVPIVGPKLYQASINGIYQPGLTPVKKK